MQELVQLLHEKHCSLVLKDDKGNVRCFYQQGVRDLDHLLLREPQALQGATIADKVVGKAAASLMACGGVKQIYAQVLSRKAIPVLDAAGIAYSYGELTSHIAIAKGDARCPLEQIVEPAATAQQAVELLHRHFDEMRSRQADK